MENNSWVIHDGNLISAQKPVSPVESRGLMYGDGCFETFRGYRGRFFMLQKHLNRLWSAAEFLELNYPDQLKVQPITRLIGQLLEKNGLQEEDSVVRIQLWRKGKRGFDILDNHESHFSILATPLPKIGTSVSLASVKIKRIPDSSLPSKFKLNNTINYIIAAKQARHQEADDALMQTVDGFVSETTIANLFWLSGNRVYTPSMDCDLLPGITRSVIMDIIKQDNERTLDVGRYQLEELYNAEAAWICNSVREIVPVLHVDGMHYNINHDYIKHLQAEYRNRLSNGWNS